MAQALTVRPPMDPESRLAAAAQVLTLAVSDSISAALAAEWIIHRLVAPGIDIMPTPAELVNDLTSTVWTYYAGIAAESEDANAPTYYACESVSAAVAVFYRDNRYVEQFKRLWRQRCEMAKDVTDDD